MSDRLPVGLWAAALALCAPACAAPSPEEHALSRRSLERFALLEVAVPQRELYGNPFVDVALDAVCTAPSGQPRREAGFFHGGEEWRVRFRPDAVGTRSYT